MHALVDFCHGDKAPMSSNKVYNVVFDFWCPLVDWA